MSIKIGNRTRNLPAFTTVSQPTAPSRASSFSGGILKTGKKIRQKFPVSS
jgi:hypothetical protein